MNKVERLYRRKLAEQAAQAWAQQAKAERSRRRQEAADSRAYLRNRLLRRRAR